MEAKKEVETNSPQEESKPNLKIVSDKNDREKNQQETVSEIQPNDINFLLDIPLKITVELGRTKILVQDLIKLHKGSVIELTKLAGEPLEVLVNDKVLAKGEVIVMNEKFGVRLTDIVNHAQRIKELGG